MTARQDSRPTNTYVDSEISTRDTVFQMRNVGSAYQIRWNLSNHPPTLLSRFHRIYLHLGPPTELLLGYRSHPTRTRVRAPTRALARRRTITLTTLMRLISHFARAFEVFPTSLVLGETSVTFGYLLL